MLPRVRCLLARHLRGFGAAVGGLNAQRLAIRIIVLAVACVAINKLNPSVRR